MLLIDFTVLLCRATLLFAKDTSIGQWLHAIAVQGLVNRLRRITAGHWICVASVLLATGLLYWLAKADGLMLLSMGSPDLAVWFTTFEISTYVDALVAVAAASSALRVKAMRLHLGTTGRKIVARLRNRRKRAARPRPHNAANDDDDGRLIQAA